MDDSLKNKARSYFDKVREGYIPKGSTVPRSRQWKGNAPTKTPDIMMPVISRKNTKGEKSTATHYGAMHTFTKRIQVGAGRTRKLTPKQILQAKYMLMGYNLRQSKLKAGYAKNVVNKTGITRQRTIVSFFEGINRKMLTTGITEDFISHKMKEWFDAKRPIVTKLGIQGEVPDYKAQQGAFDRWKGLVSAHDVAQSKGEKKREMTITEYITGEEPEVIEAIESDDI